MATIGVSIESGAMHAVLFDAAEGEVVATQMTPLDAGASGVLASSVESMRALAAYRDIDVETVGVVYRTEFERTEFEAALTAGGLTGISMFSASSAFLGWLARSPEFADADAVLLYYMGVGGVSISLADADGSSLSLPRSMTLDSISPERIGSTIPLAWEVLDDAGVSADSVALFGDPTSNRDLIDILELGLGVPVVRVGESDLLAARGAAVLALIEPHETVASERVGSAEPYARPVADMASGVVAEPIADAVATAPVRSIGRGTVAHRRKVVFAAALLAGLLSGGVALAATLPGKAADTAESSSEPTSVGADLLGATADVAPVSPADTPPAGDPGTLETRPAADVPAPVTDPTFADVYVPAPDPTNVAVLPPSPAPVVTQAAPVVPPPAPTTIDPPQFTIPVVIPEPGKSEAQLEQEAWDRHWAHTGQWLEQELLGN